MKFYLFETSIGYQFLVGGDNFNDAVLTAHFKLENHTIKSVKETDISAVIVKGGSGDE